MPSASVMILRCVGLLVARRLMAARPHQARWVASRRSGSRQTRISLRLSTCLGSGLNLYTFEGRTARLTTAACRRAPPTEFGAVPAFRPAPVKQAEAERDRIDARR